MPPEEYCLWARRHAAAFGLSRDADADMALEWADHFARQGVSPEALDRATNAMMRDPPKWREDHLARLQEALRNQSSQVAPAPPADVGIECKLCGGTGSVSVPSRKALAQRIARGLGEWGQGDPWKGWGTEAVACRCPLGLYLRTHGRGNWTTLEAYSAERPYWQDEMTAHAEHQKREASLTSSARGLDKTFGSLIDRLKRKGT